MSRILITGGSGFIGTQLSQHLRDEGHEVVHLSRNPSSQSKFPTYKWDYTTGEIDENCLEGVETIIHLAGASLIYKWTDEQKKVIVDSRVKTSRLLFDTCERLGKRLNHFISASAIGIYPTIISDQPHDEDSDQGDGFLSSVCKDWEHEARKFESISDHTTILRIGLVLGKGMGVLGAMETPIRSFVGSAFGSGRQYMPWIHNRDLVRMFGHILSNKLTGTYNGVGPAHVSNQDFTQTMADVLEKPIILPNLPAFLLKMIMGEQSVMVLTGVPISSDKIQQSGFSYDFPTLNSALLNVYN